MPHRLMATLFLPCFLLLSACGESKQPTPPSPSPAQSPAITPAGGDPASDPASARAARLNATYVGKTACAACHQKETDLWSDSHHALAMDHATDKTVLGDFSGTTFTHFAVTSRFFKRDGKFFVNTDSPDGTLKDYEIKFVFGVTPLQQYLIELPAEGTEARRHEGTKGGPATPTAGSGNGAGRLQALSAAWDVRNKKWIHLYPNEAIPHTDVLHWTKPLQNWNYMCASCHSTDLKKSYDADKDEYRTTYSEINVSCEACHGPGSEHVKWANAGGGKRDESWPGEFDAKLVNPLKGQSHVQVVESCAPCHARRRVIEHDYLPGEPLLDHNVPELLVEPLYHANGQMLDEVYNHGSFVQSKMYHRGISCATCHEPHSAKLRVQSNTLCNQCHGEKYDSVEHHHHVVKAALTPLPLREGLGEGRTASNSAAQLLDPTTKPAQAPPSPNPSLEGRGIGSAAPAPGSPGTGTACIDCHMPKRTYMVVDGRHDHIFNVPRPDLTVALGTPNACNDCHTEKERDAAWAAGKVVEWFGKERLAGNGLIGVGQQAGEHYAVAFTAARRNERQAEPLLIALAKDMNRPAIVRATAVRHLLNYPTDAARRACLDALKDPDALVRGYAIGTAEHLAGDRLGDALTPLLRDPTRFVRTESARVLSRVAKEQFADRSAAGSKAFFAALEEYHRGQRQLLDQPGAYLNLAVVQEHLGEAKKAEEFYLKAIARDWNFVPARMNLSRLYDAQDRPADAEKLLREAVQLWPESPEPRYSLGLLLGGGPAADPQKLTEAAFYLGTAAQLAKTNARMHYNYGLALKQLGKLAGAEDAIREAARLSDDDADIQQALLALYAEQGKWRQAIAPARRLAELFPNEPGAKAQLEEIRRRAGE